jgi:regulatory protein
MIKKQLTPDQALQKLRHFCGWQERSHLDVREKLYSLGIRNKDHGTIIAQLIEENHLNEERFAISYAGGKFRMKQWGRIKIKAELKKKQINDYLINKALSVINEKEYQATLQKLFQQKMKTLAAEKNQFIRKRKLQDFLLQKGFELQLINDLLHSKT